MARYCETGVPQFLHRWSKLDPYKIKISNAVRKHLPGLGQVGFVDQRQLLELAHALGSLGAQQVALAGMHAQNLAGRGDLEALLRAAMGLELQLGLRGIAWHFFESSPCVVARLNRPAPFLNFCARQSAPL